LFFRICFTIKKNYINSIINFEDGRHFSNSKTNSEKQEKLYKYLTSDITSDIKKKYAKTFQSFGKVVIGVNRFKSAINKENILSEKLGYNSDNPIEGDYTNLLKQLKQQQGGSSGVSPSTTQTIISKIKDIIYKDPNELFTGLAEIKKLEDIVYIDSTKISNAGTEINIDKMKDSKIMGLTDEEKSKVMKNKKYTEIKIEGTSLKYLDGENKEVTDLAATLQYTQIFKFGDQYFKNYNKQSEIGSIVALKGDIERKLKEIMTGDILPDDNMFFSIIKEIYKGTISEPVSNNEKNVQNAVTLIGTKLKDKKEELIRYTVLNIKTPNIYNQFISPEDKLEFIDKPEFDPLIVEAQQEIDESLKSLEKATSDFAVLTESISNPDITIELEKKKAEILDLKNSTILELKKFLKETIVTETIVTGVMNQLKEKIQNLDYIKDSLTGEEKLKLGLQNGGYVYKSYGGSNLNQNGGDPVFEALKQSIDNVIGKKNEIDTYIDRDLEGIITQENKQQIKDAFDKLNKENSNVLKSESNLELKKIELENKALEGDNTVFEYNPDELQAKIDDQEKYTEIISELIPDLNLEINGLIEEVKLGRQIPLCLMCVMIFVKFYIFCHNISFEQLMNS
jgi:hypothetical protein